MSLAAARDSLSPSTVAVGHLGRHYARRRRMGQLKLLVEVDVVVDDDDYLWLGEVNIISTTTRSSAPQLRSVWMTCPAW